MKKAFYLLLFVLGFSTNVNAAAGDTTWVQAHADKWLTYYGDYDTTVVFPSGNLTYRRIYMIFTMGKYACPGYNPNNPGDQPGQTGWCGDWDYTVQNYIMTPNGDTLELARLITPYARQTAPRTPLTWKQRYIFDVTDYYQLLKNNAQLRIHYSGYSGGFTADIKFAFIEGTPARNVMGIDRLWHGNFNYGHGTTPINTALGNISKIAPAGTQSAELKMNITGHGGDVQGCSEFCPNTYTVNLNNNQLVQQNFWRDNCGLNDLYPQSGTWLLERANWCPGATVDVFSHLLTGISANNNYSVNVTLPNYTSVTDANHPNAASYTIEAATIYYGGFNHTLDASLDDIIAPSNYEGHYRANPHSGDPVIRVKNTGSTTITSLKIEYGIAGNLSQYTWNGTLNSLSETDIDLPEIYVLRTLTGNNNTFIAKILQVNGQIDADQTNDMLTSVFTAAPKWLPQVRITFKTNSSSINGISETSWKIYDALNNLIAQRINNAINTTYVDTVNLGPGAYRLEVKDEGCDGLSWWANPGAGSGLLQVRNVSAIPLSLTGYFGGDFGCGFTQYFTADWPTGVEAIMNANAPLTIEAFPNPAQKTVTVTISGIEKVKGNIQVIDALGKIVMTQVCNNATEEIDVSGVANGVYTIVYTDGKGKMQTRLMIAK